MEKETAKKILKRIEKLIAYPARTEGLEERVSPERFKAAERAAIDAETLERKEAIEDETVEWKEVYFDEWVQDFKRDTLALELARVLWRLRASGLDIETPGKWTLDFSLKMRNQARRLMEKTATGLSIAHLQNVDLHSLWNKNSSVKISLKKHKGKGLAYAIHLLMFDAKATGVFCCPACGKLSFTYTNRERSGCDATCRKKLQRAKMSEKEKRDLGKRRSELYRQKKEENHGSKGQKKGK